MDNSSGPGFDDEPPPEPRDGWLLVRIHVPELNVYKCLQFPSDKLVWDVKQQVLASLPKELKESFNYGLFSPPSNGKAGKFLDEERRLGDYPFNGPVGYLELKYKRRVYKMLNLDERQLKALHTRANLRRFLECINGGHVEKIAKMCAKGLDPNFHCPESGETPLTVATGAKKPNKLLIALVNGGALLDYRTKDGTTALHRAVEKDSLEAVTTLLELGASPNYKDGRGITPLYISITRKCESKITESLLHDHASLGTQDNQGWNEVHQACRHGLVPHLEHLLFYGADMDGRNASGNTPLHVCAVNNQEACARMLLFRGAQRGALNYANQTPYQVAVIAGNLELAEIIQNYKTEEAVPFRGPPRYNPKRRSGIGWLSANGSIGGGSLMGTLTRNSSSMCGHHGPPSPCPSEHMPYSSASSSLSEGSSGHRSHEDDISIVTDKSLGDTSDIISDSSGVGTNSDSAACSIGHPSTTVVCMEPYAGNSVGHIRLQVGDVIEVVGSTDCGLLEGYVRGTNQSGFFPAECVQEVNLRQKNITNVATANPNQSPYQHSPAASSVHQGSPQLSLGGSSGIGGIGSSIGGTLPRPSLIHHQSPSLSVNSNGSIQALNNGHGMNENHMSMKILGGGNHHQVGQYSSATAPRVKKRFNLNSSAFNEPRTVVLHRAKRGFGFILRGAKASSQLMQLKPSDRFPALQYLDDVDPGGVADMAGLKPGDFLLAINGEDVRAASHEKVVEMIRSAGALVSMTVNSPQFPNQMHATPQYMPTHHMSSGPSTPQTSHRQCATLPRKMSLGPNAAGSERQGRPAPLPPRRDPKTTLSVGRARAKSMVAGLENGGEKEDEEIPHTKSSSVESIVTPTPTHPGTPVQLRTASIKARPTSSRITAAELEELFQRQQGETVDSSNRYSTMMTTSRFQSGTDSGAATPPANNSSPLKGPLVYGSVAEMKRKAKVKNGTLRGKPCAIPTVGTGARDLKRFHSTPDLNATAGGSSSSIWTAAVGKGHHSQDDVATLHASMLRLNTLPPPTHPPPPPPVVGQVVKVETRQSSEYESTLSLQQKLKKRVENDAVTAAAIDGVQSSFKPSANAKIYASPQELIAWKLRQTQDNRQQTSNQQQQQNSQQHYNSNQALGFAPPIASQMQQQQQLPPPPPPQQQQTQISQYAQPSSLARTNSSSNNTSSSANQYAVSQTGQNSGGINQHTTQVNSSSSNNNNINNNGMTTANIATGPAPPIPEPDYSLSESDGEDENSILVARNTKLNEKIALIDVPETSGNSQASGSSSGSGSASISHSLSVDEIQRIRSNLKTSKSSPNGFDKNEDKSLSNESETAKNDNDVENNNNNEEEGDNSSSGVSSDQEVLAASAATGTPTTAKSTDTIKKKPSVTINEEPKTIPDNNQGKDETDTTTTATKLPKTTNTSTTTIPPMQQTTTQGSGQQQHKLETPAKSTPPSQHRSLQATTTATTAAKMDKTITNNSNATTTNCNNSLTTSNNMQTTKTNVANAKAAFEAKANAATTVTSAIPNIPTTVTVKQMVQQQHAPVIQQQQQQMSASKGPKTLQAQSQQVVAKAQTSVAGRLAQQQTPQPQPNMNPNQKLIATQQQILIQQQQQQQQIAHQQHLQQILKAKAAAAAGAATTAAIVAKQQQQMAANKTGLLPTQDSQEEQRSDDGGDLSPSPPAKGFQRHNSLTRKQAAAIAMQRATRSAAVSLVQLPPPIEADSDSEMSLTTNSKSSVASGVAATSVQHADDGLVTENIVLAPPPQFCDCNDIKHAPQLQQQQQQQPMPQQQQIHMQLQQHQQQRLHQPQQQLSLHQQQTLQQQQQQHQQQQQQHQQQQHQHHHLQQQQQQQLQYQQYQQHLQHQQQLQAAMQLQMHPQHMMQQHYVAGSGNVATAAAGANSTGNMGTLGRVRIVGTLPKTNQRLH